jgi:hypothetical protein
MATGLASATESYAASALYTTLASLLFALWRIRRVSFLAVGAPRLDAQVFCFGDKVRCDSALLAHSWSNQSLFCQR